MEPTTPNPRPDPSPEQRPATPEEWERVRRSVAMLTPGAWAMRREQALAALDLLVDSLRRLRSGS